MLSIIVAAAQNNVIGRDNDLPWSLPDDLQYFKEKTKGHAIVMGRKNFESIGRVLPGRTNIVVTRQSDWSHEGCTVVGSLDDAITAAGDDEEIFIIGGGQIYALAMERADRIYLTRVHAEVEGDVMFPELDEQQWECISIEDHAADDRHAYAFSYEVWERVN